MERFPFGRDHLDARDESMDTAKKKWFVESKQYLLQRMLSRLDDHLEVTVGDQDTMLTVCSTRKGGKHYDQADPHLLYRCRLLLGFEISHCSSIEYTAAPALNAWQETSSTRCFTPNTKNTPRSWRERS